MELVGQVKKTRSKATIGTIFVFALSLPYVAAAADLADGEYDCGGGYTYRPMGKLDVKGSQFRYRPYGDVQNGFAPYSIGAKGAITWGGHFGDLDDPPARILESSVERFGLNVKYQAKPGGLINTMSCHTPGK